MDRDELKKAIDESLRDFKQESLTSKSEIDELRKSLETKDSEFKELKKELKEIKDTLSKSKQDKSVVQKQAEFTTGGIL